MKLRDVVWAGLLLMALGGCNFKLWIGDPRCYTDADCGGGEQCSANLCALPGSLAPGRKCDGSRDCREGLICAPVPKDDVLATRCAPEGEGEAGAECSSDFNCKAGFRCALVGFAGKCAAEGEAGEGAGCATNEDCQSGLYCSPGQKCEALFTAYPIFKGVECADRATPFGAYFEVPRDGQKIADFFRLPFPNAARVEDGKLDISDFPDPGPTPLGINLIKLYVDALMRDFDGFSASATVTFRFSGAIDEATLSGAMRYVDLTTGLDVPGATALYREEKGKFACANRVHVEHPRGTPLIPGHTYAVVLSTAIRSSGGDTPSADADLAELLAEATPSDSALSSAHSAYQPLRAYMTTKGIAASSVAAATVFKVADIPAPMGRLHADVSQRVFAAPTNVVRCGPGVVSPCDDGSEARKCPAASADYDVIIGKLPVPIYQQGTAPYMRAEDGGNIVEVGGVPQLVRTESVCFAMSIPKTTMPVAGWPLLVYHHGTGGSMTSFLGDALAGTFSTGAQKAAVIGFDAVEHGARRAGSTESPDNLVFNVFNPNSARDNILQGAVDIIQFGRLREGTIPASVLGAEVRFDATLPLFFGHSQGSSSGPPALAFSPGAQAVVLSGAGGGLTNSLLEKTKPQDVKQALTFLLGESIDEQHPTMTLMQTYFDRSDAVNYASLLTHRPPMGVTPKHVLQPYGIGDTYTPSSVQRNMAQAMKLAHVPMVLEDLGLTAAARPVQGNLSVAATMVTGAVIQYAPTAGEDGHFVSFVEAQAGADWRAFLSSWINHETPRIP